MPKRFAEKTDEKDRLMVLDFVALEIKYQDWFHERDSFIEEYFVAQNFNNSFVDNCKLPEHIKVECMLIKSRFML